MNHNEVEKELAGRLGKLDGAGVKTPDLFFFTGLVKAEKERIARRQNRQFALFAALSVFIVAAVLLCLLVNVYLFAAVQAVPLLVFAGLGLRAHKAPRGGKAGAPQ